MIWSKCKKRNIPIKLPKVLYFSMLDEISRSKTLECCSALTYDNRNFKIDVSSRKYSADGGEEIYWR